MRQRKKLVVAWPAYKNRDKNPYNSLLYESLEGKGYAVKEFSLRRLWKSLDVLHLHWPEDYSNKKSVLSSTATLTILILACLNARFRGAKIVWTAHNISAHEGTHKNLDWVYRKIFLNLVTDIAHLTNAGRKEFLASERYRGLTNVRHHVTPHGPYAMTARPLHERPVRKLLVLGQLRRYKRLTELIELWSMAQPQGWQLVIAGSGGADGYVDELQNAVSEYTFTTLIPKWLTDAEVEFLVADADVVMVSAPRHNSGAIYLALSGNRRVLTPDTAGSLELAAHVGTGWIITYHFPLSENSLLEILSAIPKENPAHFPLVDTWESIADAVAEIYEGSESR